MFATQFTRFLRKLYQIPDGGSGGGGGPVGDLSSAITQPPASGAPAPGAPAAGIVPGATPPAIDTRPAFTYPEDRSRWIPPHRYQEVSGRVESMERALVNYQARVRALMGVAEPEDPRKAQLKSAMKEMFPGLARLIDDPQALERMSGSRGDESFQSAYWMRHGTEMVGEAVREFATAAGVDPSKLGADATAKMARQLQAYISVDPSRREAYERRDPGFIKEFIADLTGFFVTPLRAAATTTSAQNVTRAQGLPSTRGPAGMPSGTAPAPRLKGKELHEAARQAILAQG